LIHTHIISIDTLVQDITMKILKYFSYEIRVKEMFLNKGLYRLIPKNWVSIQTPYS